MKHLLFTLTFTLAFLIAKGQVIKNPAFEMSTSPNVKIKEIESNKKYTILRLFFESPPDYYVGGWIAVMRTMYLRDTKTGKRFPLVRAENVPYFPEKHFFTGPGQQLSFTLYFERVDLTTTRVDIIENVEGGFNYFGIALIDIATLSNPEEARYLAHTQKSQPTM